MTYQPPTEEETKAFIAYMNLRCREFFCLGAVSGFGAALVLVLLKQALSALFGGAS